MTPVDPISMPAWTRDLDTANWRDIPYDPVETNYQRFVAAVREREDEGAFVSPRRGDPEGARHGAGLRPPA